MDTPTSQSDRHTADRTDRQTDSQTDDGPIAYGEPFYKRSPKNDYNALMSLHRSTI